MWGGGFNTDVLFQHLRDLGYAGALEDMKWHYYVADLGFQSDLDYLEWSWLQTKITTSAESLAFDLAGDLGGGPDGVYNGALEDLWALVVDQQGLDATTYYELYSLLFVMGDKGDIVSGTNFSVSIPGVRYGIVNDVVTEFAVNEAPVEDKGLRGCPPFTQYQRRAATFAVNNWINFECVVTDEGPHQGTNIYRFTPNSAVSVANGGYQNIPIADNDTVGVRYLVRGTIPDFRWRIKRKDGSIVSIFIDLTDGSYTKDAGLDGGMSDYRDGWYEVFIHADVLTGAGVNSQVYYDIAMPYDDPDKWFEICQVSLLNYGSGVVSKLPHVDSDNTGFTSIVSETGATSFDLDDPSLTGLKQILQGPDAEGHIEFTFVSNVDSSNNFNILTCNNTGSSVVNYTTVSGFTSTDGTNTDAVAKTLAVGDEVDLVLDFDTTGLLLTVDGVAGVKQPFVGSWGTEDLKFFYGNTINAGWIKTGSLKISDKPQWT